MTHLVSYSLDAIERSVVLGDAGLTGLREPVCITHGGDVRQPGGGYNKDKTATTCLAASIIRSPIDTCLYLLTPLYQFFYSNGYNYIQH